MTNNIAIIDYGMGNLHSVAKALEYSARRHNHSVRISVCADPKIIAGADRVVLPGVGAMRDCMSEMRRLDVIDSIYSAAQSKPFLGICIGMQALMDFSQENGGVDCLGILPGQVTDFARADNFPKALKIPHMGWNQVHQTDTHPLWKAIAQDQRFYFVHSYFTQPRNPAHSAATTDYGIRYTSALAKDNLFAVQFHPEKSADSGLQLFANFIQWDGQA